MRDDDPQVEHAKKIQEENPYSTFPIMHTAAPPAYYPKSVLKAAIKEMVELMRSIQADLINGEYRSSAVNRLEETIKKYEDYCDE